MTSQPRKFELQRRLAVIWSNLDEDDPDKEQYRYVPRAIPSRAPGSGAWDVFDRKESRFITSKKEILKLTFEDCCERLLQ
jgi:hypothetical protein